MKLLLTIILVLFTMDVFAQEVKMVTEWETAKALADKENKDILVILTGSEWCKPCKKMDKYVIADPEFQKYAHENLILFLVDLPKNIVVTSTTYKKLRAVQKQVSDLCAAFSDSCR